MQSGPPTKAGQGWGEHRLGHPVDCDDAAGSSPDLRPFIGVCAACERAPWSFWDQEAALVAGTYLDAVRAAGGLPLALVPEDVTAANVTSLLDRVDGLLLVGGADVRDRFEFAMIRGAFVRDLSVLGICRGMQILNVATGGTLHQDLVHSGFAGHRRALGRLDDSTAHGVELEPGSLVAEAMGVLQDVVNSHHHQGIAGVGDGGRVTARSLPDEAVEAIEWPAQRYALGVQWHPDALELSATISTFVEAAAGLRLSASPVSASVS